MSRHEWSSATVNTRSEVDLGRDEYAGPKKRAHVNISHTPTIKWQPFSSRRRIHFIR